MKAIGNARLVGKFENQSPEWHALRKQGVGGSDISSIMRVNPWSSPFTVWADKTGVLEKSSSGGSEAMEWGTLLEPVILAKFKSNHPELRIRQSPGTYRAKNCEWMLANPDGLYRTLDGKWGILEIKTAMYEDDWANGVPLYYQTQVLWYSAVFGFTAPARVAVLFHGNKYREFEVEIDDFAQSIYIAEATKFWELVQSKTPPEVDGSSSTQETVRAMHPDIDDAEVDLGELFLDYQVSSSDLEEATRENSRVKSLILQAMGNAKRGVFEGRWVMTRQSRNGGTPFLVEKRG